MYSDLSAEVRAVLNWAVENNFAFFFVCFTTLCDWLAKFAPFPQRMRSKTQTNCNMIESNLSQAFSRARRRLQLWLVHYAAFERFLIGWSNPLIYDGKLETARVLVWE